MRVLTGVLAVLAAASMTGCESTDARAVDTTDPLFAALQQRGAQAMGVDQYTSTHLFDALADGGRVELQRDVNDPAGVEQIRHHLQLIAKAFESGDFSTPEFVHAKDVPGVATMASLSDRIEYVYRELPRGAELRAVTSDPEALAAIHEFMAFQRQEHHAGGVVQHAPDHAHPMPHPGGQLPGGSR
jgi:hypothetical protein